MRSGTHSSYRDPGLPVGALFSPPRLIDRRELDRLAAPRSITGKAGWRPSVIQGGRCSGPGEVEMGSVRPDLRHSGRRWVLHTRAVVRMGLAAAIMAALLVVFSIPRAGADRGPAPAVSHIVQPGDTLWSIAEMYTLSTGDVRATVALIRSANERSSGFLAVGDVIEVPVEEIPGALSGASG